MIAKELEPLADAVVRREADQDIRGRNFAFDKLSDAVKAVPQHLRHWVFALACFGIAGYRLYQGARGLNLVFVIIAAAIGFQYAVRALRTPKSQ